MDNTSLFMQISQCFCNLNDHMPTEVFGKVCQTHNLVEQLASRGKLKNDVVVLSRFGKVDQLDNVGVIELAHDLDFFKDVRSLQGRSQWTFGKDVVFGFCGIEQRRNCAPPQFLVAF